jgi:hypothetical protein
VEDAAGAEALLAHDEALPALPEQVRIGT